MAEKAKEEEAKSLLTSTGSGDEDSGSFEVGKEYSSKREEHHGQQKQKISGKAWGVLQLRKLRLFPFSIFFIVGNEFCERFSYYGMRAVLVLYLNRQLKFSEDSATAVYHAFIMLCYLLPLFGAIISDSCLGKYWTILSLSILYAVGNVLVSVSAIPFNLEANIALAAVGLIVIAMGTGGIKPCVSAFGGDQFKEDQADMLRRFFSLFYFSINAGSVISTLLTPALRSYVQCFGEDECFSLAFGVPAVLMVISIGVFIAGTRFYHIKKPKRDAALLFFNVPASIVVATYRRFRYGKSPEKKRFLQYASPHFDDQFLEDVRLLLRVLVMLLPLPIFWTLFDQQGSRWTLQAQRMNGRLGKFTLQPDQVQALNPILILVFIPLFEAIVYPIFSKCHLLKKPLQRMVAGMVLAGLAFVLAGVVELQVAAADSSLGAGEGKALFTNTLPETLQIQLQNTSFNLSRGEHHSFVSKSLGSYSFSIDDDSGSMTYNDEFNLTGQHINDIVISQQGGSLQLVQEVYREEIPAGDEATVHIVNAISSEPDYYLDLLLCTSEDCGSVAFNVTGLRFLDFSNRSNISVSPTYFYTIRHYSDSSEPSYNMNGSLSRLGGGAMYTLVLTEDPDSNDQLILDLIEVDPPLSVSIFLQFPMYVVITAGEVMFSVTGLEFAYSQAPPSMKALCQAAWLWTVAFGNLFVIIIAESKIFSNQAIEFFFFAACIIALSVLFAFMSVIYKYVDIASIYSQGTEDLDQRPHSETSTLIMEKESAENGRTSYTKETRPESLSESEM